MNNTLKPTEKVQAGAYAGAAAIVLIWAAGLFGLAVPAEIAGAIVLLLSGAGAWIKTEGSGWFRSGTGRRAARTSGPPTDTGQA